MSNTPISDNETSTHLESYDIDPCTFERRGPEYKPDYSEDYFIDPFTLEYLSPGEKPMKQDWPFNIDPCTFEWIYPEDKSE